uniref:RWP-RK domain-containing protein n=1 Tax=Hyaloperonospora arabidopsidis (strain Emoy2) TaxID=559515 RepID=M4B2R1_HYAAE
MEFAHNSNGDNCRRLCRRLCSPVASTVSENSEDAHTLFESDFDSSVHDKSENGDAPPCEGHYVSLAPLSMGTVDSIHATIVQSPTEASATGISLRLTLTTQEHASKRRSLRNVVEDETQRTIPGGNPQAQRDDMCHANVLVASPAVHSDNFEDRQLHQKSQSSPRTENDLQTIAPSSIRISTRRTATMTRWSSSKTNVHEQGSTSGVSRKQKAARPRQSSTSAVNRLIPNATRNITFAMLQLHFERPLQQAADSFGVCTTLLKKICRRNGIDNWPHRRILGLRKSIASMAKQVEYFDGEQKRTYANQLQKLTRELEAYIRTGIEPTQEFLRTLDVETAVEQQQKDATVIDLQVIPVWSSRTSLEMSCYCSTRIVPEPSMPSRSLSSMDRADRTTHGLQLQVPAPAIHQRALPSIASILQHQSYSSPSRAASTSNLSTITTSGASRCIKTPHQEPTWQYLPPAHDETK